MILLIDAFNLMYKFDDLESAMHNRELITARRGLEARFRQFRTRHKKNPPEVHLFFDGKQKPGDETRREKRSGLHIYFSHDLSADHLIKEFIKRSPQPGNLTVVTSDKDIIDFARRHKVVRKTSEEFASEINALLNATVNLDQTKDTDPKVSDEDVSFWLKAFKRK